MPPLKRGRLTLTIDLAASRRGLPLEFGYRVPLNANADCTTAASRRDS